jgi:DNA-binding HxlR family transcriptional regulator
MSGMRLSASTDKNDTVSTPSKRHRCPVMSFQRMISGKYKLRILWDLRDGPRRDGEIRNGLLRGADGTREVTPRVLSRELKALAQSGFIVRKDFGVVPPKVEYIGSARRGEASSRSSLQSATGGRVTCARITFASRANPSHYGARDAMPAPLIGRAAYPYTLRGVSWSLHVEAPRGLHSASPG